jgi:sporulation protein YlmC with PRC-barrel domain
MSRIALSNTGSWKLKFEDTQDIRGYRALDKDGDPVGRVDTMIIDTDAERVTSVVLEDGQEFPAKELSIGDGVVYLTGTTVGAAANDESVTTYDDYGHVVARESAVDFDDAHYDAHRDAFRQHHQTTYGATGNAYDDYDPAYRYGFEQAYDDRYRDRVYTDAESDLRTGYGERYNDSAWDDVQDAVRYGYRRAQHGVRRTFD